jgi:hypothetical protein
MLRDGAASVRCADNGIFGPHSAEFRETILLEAPAWVLTPPIPRRQVADANTEMMSIHLQLQQKIKRSFAKRQRILLKNSLIYLFLLNGIYSHPPTVHPALVDHFSPDRSLMEFDHRARAGEPMAAFF